MEKIKMNGWIWICNPNLKKVLKETEKIKGKYLFFGKKRSILIKLAKEILKKYNLCSAKVPDDGFRVGSDWVLCIYDKSPKLKEELKQYADQINIKYRYWKSDEDTLEGKYSQEFLNKTKQIKDG